MKKLDKKNVQDLLALTPMQEGMLYHYLLNPKSNLHFEQLCLDITGRINIQRFKEAWNEVVRANEMLRTVFRWEQVNRPIQLIQKHYEPTIIIHDLSTFTLQHQKIQLESIKGNDTKQKFDLQDVPFRITFCKTGNNTGNIIISNHHILYDGWSTGIILKEFFEAYESLGAPAKDGKAPKVKPKTLFKEYQKRRQYRNKIEEQEFWQNYLQTISAARPQQETVTEFNEIRQTGKITSTISPQQQETLLKYSHKNNITTASILFSAWGQLLMNINDSGDVRFDTTVSGRNIKINGIEDMVGLFINTLPLRITGNPGESPAQFLDRNNRMLQEWRLYENSSQHSIPKTNYASGGNTGIDTVMVIENYPLDQIIMKKSSSLAVTGYTVDGTSRYDITALIVLQEDITLHLTYNKELLDREEAEQIAAHYVEILDSYTSQQSIQQSIQQSTARQQTVLLENRLTKLKEKLRQRRQKAIREHRHPITPSEAPRNAEEEKLAEIWAEIFGTDNASIGIDVDFFQMGGHSLTATRLCAQIQKELGRKIPLGEIFRQTTIRSQAAFIRNNDTTGEKYDPIPPADNKTFYPLSPAQHRFYMMQKLDPDSTYYNGPAYFQLEGPLDEDRLNQAFKRLIQRHEILRTAFEEQDGEPVQRIHQKVEFQIEIRQEEDEKEEEKEVIRPFDLTAPPLLRAVLVKQGRNRHKMILDMHHIITDGTTLYILNRDLSEFYRGDELPPPKNQYIDITQWIHQRLKDGTLKKQEEFWLRHHPTPPPVLNMPTDHPRPAIQDHAGKRIIRELKKQELTELHRHLKKTGTTLYQLLMTVLTIQLSKYSGQEDIVVGTPIAGRNHPDTQETAGLFLETQAIRTNPDNNKTVQQYREEIKQITIAAAENQEYPFNRLVNQLVPENRTDLSRNPMFDVMLNVLNQNRNQLRLEGLTITPIPHDAGVAKVDITLEAMEQEDCLILELEYSTALYNDETMARFLRHFANILRHVQTGPAIRLAEIELPDEEEKKTISDRFNNTASQYDRQKTVMRQFEDRVRKNPEKIAVIGPESHQQLTYGQLNSSANRIAHYLRSKGAGPGTIVGLLVSRTPRLYIAQMAILKAGAAYLPLDPDYPGERLRYMLNDSSTRHRITEQQFNEKNSINDGIDNIYIDNENNTPPPWQAEPDTDPQPSTQPGDPAYIIYTSGSTGRPKGVVVAHRNLTAYIHTFTKEIDIKETDVMLQQASVSFDAYVEEVFPALVKGMTLAQPDRHTIRDSQQLARYITENNVTVIDTSPLMISELNHLPHPPKTLRLIISGGDVLKKEYIRQLNKTAILYNTYGPTETTVCATYHRLNQNDENRDSIPIGKPITNTRIYILDHYHNQQPVGIVGEICIAGEGVTQGYLNRPEQTAERFIPISINSSPEIIYKTGDLGKWLPDGSIEFSGRKDRQVNIRGYRIELGEIEARLSQYDDIENVLVTPVGINQNAICAYFTAPTPKTAGELKEALARTQPEYMIPRYYIQLDEFPRGAGGKINLRALPEPTAERFRLDAGAEYQPPSNHRERQVMEIWKRYLQHQRIGITDDYFDLGGDSILANRCIADIRREMGVEIPLRKFFENPTVKAVAEEIETQRRHARTDIPPITKRPDGIQIPLSFPQERLWFLQTLDPENMAYFVPRIIRMTGSLRHEVLERTMTEIIRRHEILRTVFPTIDGQPLQQILEPYEFNIPRIDLSQYTEDRQQQEVNRWLKEEGRKGFDFETGPMLRLTVLKLSETVHYLVLTEHHLVHDGWTQGVLLNEFISLFGAYSESNPSPLPELPLQFADYCVWQRDYIQGEVLQHHLDYWKNKLEGMPPVLELPADRPRPPAISGDGDLIVFRLPADLSEQLRSYSRRQGTTLFMTMLTVFKIQLYRYTGQGDLCVGTAAANRRFKEMEGMLGMLINTLALRTEINGQMTFKQCLEQVKNTCLEAYEHEDTPFGKVVEVMQPERSLSYTPLFQTIFSFMDVPTVDFELPGLELHVEDSHNRSAKFDINIIVVTNPDDSPNEPHDTGEIMAEWEYNTDIFDRGTMEQMVTHYTRLLEECVKNPGREIAQQSIMSEAEINRQEIQWNRTEQEYPRNETILRLIERQAQRTPDAIAVQYEDRQLTYRQLNRRAETVARRLRQRGITAETIVAIQMEPSLEQIIAIQAIHKAGGAYLPIDPTYPQERIDYMMTDSNAQLLLTAEDINIDINKDINKGINKGINKSITEDITEDITIDESDRMHEATGSPNRLCYVIYTSGSTGRPKGVMVEHRSLVNFVYSMQRDYRNGIAPGHRCLSLTNMCFDVSVFEIFLPLTFGGTLHLLPRQKIYDVKALAGELITRTINVAYIPPSLLSDVADALKARGGQPTLNKMLVGVEPIKDHVLEKYVGLNPEIVIVNGYGPTEATICATRHLYRPRKATGDIVPIGRPLANTRIYLLDTEGRPVPRGVSGELCIAGDQLARGYLNRPELTAEKFVLKQSGITDEYIYRTGDQARYLHDGTIRFMGRVDEQVKIRGFRVEPGEIKHRLQDIEEIKEAFVMVRERSGGEKYLCAYIVSDNPPATKDIREHLAEQLPEYMIPSNYVQLERIPLNRSGKVDKKALPEPGLSLQKHEHIPPRDEVEQQLAQQWQNVLGQKEPGIDDNFFEHGGHSLKASQLTAGIYKALNVKLELARIFKTPTIRELARIIKQQEKKTFETIRNAEKKEYYPLTSAQKRLYILQQMEPGVTVYNLPVLVALEGQLDAQRLEKTFKELIQRHGSLRTAFEIKEEETVQRIYAHVDFEVEHCDLQDEYEAENVDIADNGRILQPQIQALIQRFIRPFNLSGAPLLRVRLIRLGEHKHILQADMHHIITDGTSHEIFLQELTAIYTGNGDKLPNLRIQYKDYAQWCNTETRKSEIDKQAAYWVNQLDRDIPVLQLPYDYPRPPVQRFEGHTVEMEIDEPETSALNRWAGNENVTMFMVMQTIYNILLAKISGQQDIVVGFPAAGRRHPDLQRIIGMFVNTLAMRNKPEDGKTVHEFLQEVKTTAVQAFENQDYPFEELVEKVVNKRDLSRNPLFDAMLLFQNMDRAPIRHPGLTAAPLKIHNRSSKVDITAVITETGGRMKINIEYAAALFKQETVQRFTRYIKKIISELLNDPQRQIRAVDIVPEEEKRRMVEEFNQTHREITGPLYVHRLIEEQVQRTPQRIAVVDHSQTVTYEQLNRQANRCAHRLIKAGITPDRTVGIMVDRTAGMLIAILAVLKAGGAYIPLDPNYPVHRINYILEKSTTTVMICDGKQNERLKQLQYDGHIIDISEIPQSPLDLQNTHNPNPPINPNHLAYVIYTSGSTGNPKGVMLEHFNVVNFVYAVSDRIDFAPDKTILGVTTISFDIFALETLLPLSRGMRIVIADEEQTTDPEQLEKLIIRHQIDMLQFTPSRLSLMLNGRQNLKSFDSISEIMLGGEALPRHLLEELKQSYTGKIYNMYAPTETTIYSTIKDMTSAEAITIGTPVANTQLYIVDRNRKLQPLGVAGELCIGGYGVARGYLNNPQLTALQFTPPLHKSDMLSHQSYQSCRLYKTGDLARWLSNGEIEFLGRIDHQVKIRGFRIELEEIEEQLRAHEAIKEAAVTVTGTGADDKAICVYTVIRDKRNIWNTEIREHLSRTLPDYMLPSYYIKLEHMPLTPSGKIDRKSLPEPDKTVGGTAHLATAPPRNQTELLLQERFAHILKLDNRHIGIDADFFQMGGHSLKATMLLAAIQKKFKVKVSLGEFFKTPTIRGLSRRIAGAAGYGGDPIEPVEEMDFYPQSPAQKRIFILQQMTQDSTVYNIHAAYEVNGHLDTEKLQKAIQLLIRRHESLRTSFGMRDGQPVQYVHDNAPFQVEYQEYREAQKVKKPDIPTLIHELIQPFDLSRVPLIRVGQIRLEAHRHILVVDLHHIISDGTAMELLVKEFTALYNDKELPPVTIQYKDVAHWQNSRSYRETLQRQEQYWLKEFEGEIPVLELPTDRPRPPAQTFEGARCRFDIDSPVRKDLNITAQANGMTMYMMLQAAYAILLSKLSGQEEIVIGTPVAGRNHAGMENIVGIFINTLPVKTAPKGNMSLRNYLQQVKQKSLDAQSAQEYQYEELVERLGVPRDAARNPLFDVVYTHRNTDAREIRIAGLTLTPLHYETTTAKFDLTLTSHETPDGITLNLEYDSNLFNNETIRRYIGYFNHILSQVAVDPDIQVKDIEILPPEEKHRILYKFNNELNNELNKFGEESPTKLTLPELFQRQVQKTPDHVALVSLLYGPGNETVTYRELDNKANRLARRLQTAGVLPGTVVALLTRRSIEMHIAIQAIQKTGAAYLPLNPQNPQERNSYMIKDSGTKHLLTTTSLMQDAAASAGTDAQNNREIFVHYIDSPTAPTVDTATDNTVAHMKPLAKPAHYSYIIYTSGSTGKPKGVPITHANICPLIHYFHREFNLRDSDRTLQNSSYFFDFSVMEIFNTLTTGASIIIVEMEKQLDPAAIARIMEQQNITVLHTTPTQLKVYLNARVKLKTLKHLYIGGEILTGQTTAKVQEYVEKNCRIYNVYGPTEATILTTVHRLQRTPGHREAYRQMPVIPIGKAVANLRLFVLDKYRSLCPINVPGELYIAGDGVANGYLNNPQLTAEKFVQPQSIQKEILHNSSVERLYKSGDIVRWLPDGTLDFIGRRDHQVKIRGLRIELGEIENRLVKHPAVREAVVLCRDNQNNGKYLCAYVHFNQSGQDKDEEEPNLREYLKKELPDYMVPSFFVSVDGFTFTPNGKIDLRALPEPKQELPDNHSTPANAFEAEMARHWADVLGIEPNDVGMETSFFDLGGHSLKAVELVNRMHQAYNVKIPLTEIFKSPTVRELTQYLQQSEKNIFTGIPAAEKKEYYPLTAAQKRLYILYRMDQNNTGYNIPVIRELKGPLDKKRLESAFRRLVERHESLRTAFRMVKEQPVQQIHRHVEFQIENSEYRNEYGNEYDNEYERESGETFVRPFDLSKPPLMRVRLRQDSEERHTLMLDIHHIVADGISMQLLINDLLAHYAGENPPPLTLQYKDIAQWQTQYPVQRLHQQQGDFWKALYGDDIPVLELPADNPRPAVQTYEGGTYRFPIPPGQTRCLNELARTENATLYQLLMAAYNILLANLSGQEDIVVGTPVAGRRHADQQNIIGMFVNTLAVRTQPEGNKTFRHYLREVKTQTLDAFENQDYPFEDLVEQLEINRDASRNPLFDVMFVLQDMQQTEIKIPGLTVTEKHSRQVSTKFDLTLRATPQKDIIRVTVEYNTGLYRHDTIRRFTGYFNTIIEAILETPHQPIGEIRMIPETERRRLITQYNETETAYPREKTIHRLFREQARRTPDKVAVTGPRQQQITYRQLDRRTDTLARRLRQNGIEPGGIVGIQASPSIEMIIAILGILKTGSAYMPIDPKNPEERINYMMEDSRAITLLHDTVIEALSTPHKTDRQHPETTEVTPDITPGRTPGSTPDQLVYVIYTSGSTGKPKGVLLNHRNLVNYASWFIEAAGLTPADHSLMVSSFAFDLGYTAIYPVLLSGGTLHTAAEETYQSPDHLLEYIRQHRISYIKLTPSLYSTLTESPRYTAGNRGSLRLVVMGGEAIKINDVVRHYEVNPKTRIMNHYGPTEATIGCVAQIIDKDRLDHYIQTPVIGRPIHNMKAYILDKYLRLVPEGVAGELCIAGDGIARGYLNRPELTAEKFIQNRWSDSPNDRLYRTGDRARQRPDGTIQFLGRMDGQVKIRGYRIELGEIESELLKLPAIKEAAVIIRTTAADTYICAYVVSGEPQQPGTIKDAIAKRLPPYAVPAYIMQIEQIPLTGNGKLDRKQLPEPAPMEQTGEYSPPATPTEHRLAKLWSQLLGIDIFDGNADFFQQGGHSLKAIVMSARIRKQFDVHLTLAEIFAAPTIKKMAELIAHKETNRWTALQPTEEKEYYDTSSAQKRLYTLQQMNPGGTGYNMPAQFRILGPLDWKKVKEAFNRLIERHDSLRTSFHMIKGKLVQRIHETVAFEPIYIDNTIDNTTFIRPFDLSGAPLLRVRLIKENREIHILQVDMHHTISDGQSRSILVNEFIEYYRGNRQHPLRIQYKDYTQWQNHPAQQAKKLRQQEYWLKQIDGQQPELDLPTDNIDSDNIDTDNTDTDNHASRGQTRQITLKPETTAAVKKLARQHGTTTFILQLAVYNVLLAKLTGQEDIVVGTPIAGRTHSDLEPLIGMFVNTLALRNQPNGTKTFKEFLLEVSRNTMEAFENQDYPLEELVDHIAAQGNFNAENLFRAMFIQISYQYPNMQFCGLEMIPMPTGHNDTKFDLNVIVKENENKDTVITVQYRESQFYPEDIQRFTGYYVDILEQVLQDTEIKLEDIAIAHDVIMADIVELEEDFNF